MEMEEDYRREIEKIIGRMYCPKDFICYRSGLENLCRAGNIGSISVLECLEREPHYCLFSSISKRSWFCDVAVQRKVDRLGV